MAVKKPYNWAGAANVNWFPGLAGMPAGTLGKAITTWAGGLPQGGFPGSIWSGARPPAGGGGGGGNPYASLINDMLNQQRANFSAESTADAAARDAAIRRYVISYGEVPDFAKLGISSDAQGVLAGAINDQVRQLAQQNTAEGTSIKARMDAANAIAMRQIPSTLAGRGILHSGQTGYDLGQQALQHKQTVFDTLNEMLGNVEGAVSNFAQAERQRQMALAQAEMEAAMQAAQFAGGTSMGGGYYGAPVNNPAWKPYGAGTNLPWTYKPPVKKPVSYSMFGLRGPISGIGGGGV